MMRLFQISLLLTLISFSAKAQEIAVDSAIVAGYMQVSLEGGRINLSDSVFGGLTVPYHGKVISKFGRRGSRMHTGTDVKLLKGDPIMCAFDGVVDIAATHYGYGLLVTVKHAHNVTTYYSHLSKIKVKKGEVVKSGQVIGLGGATGRATTAHLHFELRVAGKPLDAEQYIDFGSNRFLTTVIDPPGTKPLLAKAPSSGSIVPAQGGVAGNGVDNHVIRRGDTLYGISRRYGTSVNELCSLNGISPSAILKIGDVLKVR
jgi:LysM repeat protein